MDQSRALNALAPFLALAKSANSPRAAADLITQATSASNTYVFAELLQQANVQALRGHEQFGGFYELLRCFTWGTWESFKATTGLPQLSDAQARKLKLLSLMTIASEKTARSNLNYDSLCTRLDLASSIELEQLVTQAVYSDLIAGALNPARQTVVITSVAPLRDLAPGSVTVMVAELDAWSSRCASVLTDLEAEIAKIKADAARRHARELKTERQIRDAAEDNDKGRPMPLARGTHNMKAAGGKRFVDEEEYDAMELDEQGNMTGGGGRGIGGSGYKKSSSSAMGSMLRRTGKNGGGGR